jgi:uncharacterized protein (DUF983 family)
VTEFRCPKCGYKYGYDARLFYGERCSGCGLNFQEAKEKRVLLRFVKFAGKQLVGKEYQLLTVTKKFMSV